MVGRPVRGDPRPRRAAARLHATASTSCGPCTSPSATASRGRASPGASTRRAPRSSAGTIRSSLFGAIEATGEGDQLALDLADVFAWDVDFNTELQPGDSFRVAVEKQYVDGEFRRATAACSPPSWCAGRARCAPYATRRRRGAGLLRPGRTAAAQGLPALSLALHENLVALHDLAPAPDPRRAPAAPRRRLRGPVRHAGPCRGRRARRRRRLGGRLRPHGAAAPRERLRDPVRAPVAGRRCEPGQRIEQGTLVGAVGATGLATGPHLDYRMARNGQFVDPLKRGAPAGRPDRAVRARGVRALAPRAPGPPGPGDDPDPHGLADPAPPKPCGNHRPPPAGRGVDCSHGPPRRCAPPLAARRLRRSGRGRGARAGRRRDRRPRGDGGPARRGARPSVAADGDEGRLRGPGAAAARDGDGARPHAGADRPRGARGTGRQLRARDRRHRRQRAHSARHRSRLVLRRPARRRGAGHRAANRAPFGRRPARAPTPSRPSRKARRSRPRTAELRRAGRGRGRRAGRARRTGRPGRPGRAPRPAKTRPPRTRGRWPRSSSSRCRRSRRSGRRCPLPPAAPAAVPSQGDAPGQVPPQ